MSDTSQIELALRLLVGHERPDAFDAILAAAAIGANVKALVAADAPVVRIEELPHVALGSAAFDQLLAA